MRGLAGFLVSGALLFGAGPAFEQQDGKIAVKLDGKPFTSYHYSDKWDKPFLHPILSSSGEVVTRGWPVEPLPGDSNDHTWRSPASTSTTPIVVFGTRTGTLTASTSGGRRVAIKPAG
jgi:hypothetical protein